MSAPMMVTGPRGSFENGNVIHGEVVPGGVVGGKSIAVIEPTSHPLTQAFGFQGRTHSPASGESFEQSAAPPVRNVVVQMKQTGSFSIANLPGVMRGKTVSARPGGPSFNTYLVPVASLPDPSLVRGLRTNEPPPEQIVLFVPSAQTTLSGAGLANGLYTSAKNGMAQGLFAHPLVTNWRGTAQPARR